MAKEKILSEIKEAEDNAHKMVDDGIKRKNDRIASARAEAREIIKQAEVDAQKSAQSAMKSAEESITSDKAKIVENGGSEAKTIASSASSKIDEAVTLIINEFERAIHA
ncbi:V/A-type H+-transporting ATPase subunit G/H [Methanolobus vulcani]|jgi:V/A-type H+-transporting ATPase subunit G/H|uniref:V/A-type H+-transporting ATPase subunit G/H n=1 Tax=Methanolobus vulcani TaxID=38026 RepID=A0A7Z7AWX2_9EURY|nr:ATP synthase archaeal subunit H [Methanolobus vulcani]MDK2825059.1 V/A-type H+/Na+-transporting ATPase subunit [Methanolobus sp.]SDF88186.1 V/A-type H+-transporting ATPase subunit G/H [Methanolobus vulcani]